MELTAEKIAELKQKHGNELIAATTPNGVTMVFKKPSKAAWSFYQDGLTKDSATRSGCFMRFALDCVVLPSQQDAAGLFAEYPGMPTKIAAELSELAGLSDELDIKKL